MTVQYMIDGEIRFTRSNDQCGDASLRFNPDTKKFSSNGGHVGYDEVVDWMGDEECPEIIEILNGRR